MLSKNVAKLSGCNMGHAGPLVSATRGALDKSEGVVKDKDLLCSAEHRVFRQRG